MATDLKLFIAGEWTEGTGDDHYEVVSPVDAASTSTTCPRQPRPISTGRCRPPKRRPRRCGIGRRSSEPSSVFESTTSGRPGVDDVARILTMEQGKPFEAEAIDDIAESGDYFQIAAEDVKRSTVS